MSSTYNTYNESVTVAATTGGASATVLYTVPANHGATVDYLGLSNGSNSTSKVSVQFYHADDAAYHFLTKEHSVSGNDTYQLITSNRFHLHAGDKLVIYADTANAFEATMSARVYLKPNKT